MAIKETAENILLGYGVVKINGEPVGLTRGGSSFKVEREVRDIGADGDKGPVKGRQVIDEEIATLSVKTLEMFSADEISKYFPATKLTTGKIESTLQFKEDDYVAVTWSGKTLAGNPVVIEIPIALNKEGLDFTLEDKDEVVPELTFTGVYLEDARNSSSWSIDFTEGEV